MEVVLPSVLTKILLIVLFGQPPRWLFCPHSVVSFIFARGCTIAKFLGLMHTFLPPRKQPRYSNLSDLTLEQTFWTHALPHEPVISNPAQISR